MYKKRVIGYYFMKLSQKILFSVLIFFILILTLRGVSSVADPKCSGKHNLQVEGAKLPETGTGSSGRPIIKIFVLPEISGFKELYQFFSVTSAKAVLSCALPTSCDFYVNGQVCLSGLPGNKQDFYTLPCTQLFKDGINTMSIHDALSSSTGDIKWVFLETKISSFIC